MSKNMSQLLKQAQIMQSKIGMLQKELEAREIEVSSGGGAIKIKITGKQKINEIKISPECVSSNDIAGLEDMIVTAVNHAVKESQDMVSQAMGKVTGGINIPGLF
jgi:nucleoid-associated protein EbfC